MAVSGAEGGFMRRRLGVLALIVLGAVPAFGQAVSQNLRGQLKIHRTLLEDEFLQLQEQQGRLGEAWVRVEREMADLLRAHEQGETLETLQLRDEDLRQAESELLMMVFAVQRLRSEMISKRAAIEATEKEIRRLEEEVGIGDDPLSGTWRVVWEPGGLEGQMYLRLNGTLVDGSYRLSGGWTGSLRGTLVSNKVRLERIDSQAGFAAVLNGRLQSRGDSAKMQGTWEATELGSGLPGAGTWVAEKLEETEE
jgi:hypothetical protein